MTATEIIQEIKKLSSEERLKIEKELQLLIKQDDIDISIDRESRHQLMRKEVEQTSKYLEEKWQAQNRNVVHTSEEIDANCF